MTAFLLDLFDARPLPDTPDEQRISFFEREARELHRRAEVAERVADLRRGRVRRRSW